jgi:hypothetical protein
MPVAGCCESNYFNGLDNKPANWQTDLMLTTTRAVGQNDVAFGSVIRTVGESSYYVLSLDVNQQGKNNPSTYLSLNDIQVYTRSAQITTAEWNTFAGKPISDFTSSITGTTLGWQIHGDILINPGKLGSDGSGYANMFLLVPAAAFDGVNGSEYVYFYSKAGVSAGGQAGYEEWSIPLGTSSTPVPEFPVPVPEPYEYGFVGVILLAGLAGHHVVCQRKPAVAFR